MTIAGSDHDAGQKHKQPSVNQSCSLLLAWLMGLHH